MTYRRRTIPRRTPIFLGCEGESEQAYGQFLNELAHAANLHIHLEVVNLSPGAGDPVSRMRRAHKQIERRQRNRTEFRLRAVLLDSDQIDNNPHRKETAEKIGREHQIDIIWQSPCHEAFLLRHFAEFENRRPVARGEIDALLHQVWPDYQKPMTRLRVAKKLTIENVRRASQAEPALCDFLRAVGLL